MIVGIPVIRAGHTYLVSPHFGRAPNFAFVEVSGSDYRVVEVVENPHVSHEHGRGANIIDLLTSRNVSAVIVSGVGYGAFMRLKDRGVKIYYLPAGREREITLEEAVRMFINNELVEAAEPEEHCSRGR